MGYDGGKMVASGSVWGLVDTAAILVAGVSLLLLPNKSPFEAPLLDFSDGLSGNIEIVHWPLK